jgi:hypothetical protein
MTNKQQQQQQQKPPVPLVILLDLDGTIIGDISPQVCEYEILNEHQPSQLKTFKELLTAQLRSTAIVRPGFAEFVRSVQAKGIELFLYTASDSRWASFFVPVLEKALSLKLNRPLFTRTHCRLVNGEYRKPTRAVLHSVFSSLKRKYRGLRTVSDLNQQIAMIDNSNVLSHDAAFSVGLVMCKTYDFSHNYDVLRLVSDETLAKKTSQIVHKLVQYRMLSVPTVETVSCDRVRAAYFRTLSDNLLSKRSLRKTQAKDQMWPELAHIFDKYKLTHFSAKALDYMCVKASS